MPVAAIGGGHGQLWGQRKNCAVAQPGVRPAFAARRWVGGGSGDSTPPNLASPDTPEFAATSATARRPE